MFFGGSPGKEDVKLGELNGKIDGLFDKKVEKFAARAARLSQEIANVKREFLNACDEFDKVSAEPDLEYERWMNPNYIKGQKPLYCSALKGLFGKDAEQIGPTAYARHSSELSALEALNGEMLRTNAKFRSVVYAYPKYMNRFKNAQHALDSLMIGLRQELERVARESGEYNEMVGHLYRISALTEETEVLESRLAELHAGPVSAAEEKEKETQEIEAKISAAQGGLRAIEGKMADISSRVTSLFVPLEKAARLYDYFSLKKAKLADAVTNPTQKLSTENGLHEFNGLLEDMKKAIESKKLEIKKPAEALSQIERIKEANISGDFSELALLEKERQTARDEISFLSKSMNEIKSRAMEREALTKRISDTKEKLGIVSDALQKEKGVVEQLVMKYYKKKIAIV